MKRASNSMATEVLNNLEAVCFGSSLNCSADAIDGQTSARILVLRVFAWNYGFSV
jgi:hypothetical protein